MPVVVHDQHHTPESIFPIDLIYWVTLTKISVCEGCEGCTVRKSGPGWRLVREPPAPGPVCVRVPADRSPRYTNFLSLRRIGTRTGAHAVGFNSQLKADWYTHRGTRSRLQNRNKIATISRRFAPKCFYIAYLWVSRIN